MTQTWSQPFTVETFNYTGAVQTFVVPANVGRATVRLWGAGASATNQRKGGYVEGVLDVTPGETLYIYVGQEGSIGNGGWPGGGAAPTSNEHGITQVTAEGGAGWTGIRQGTDDRASTVAVAGGAGADAQSDTFSANLIATGRGGRGGAAQGEDGQTVDTGNEEVGEGGPGGTQSAGGTAIGTGNSGGPGTGGAADTGGYVSGDSDVSMASGAGGAGWYGGASGDIHLDASGDDAAAGGGGAGSNYVDPLAEVLKNIRGGGNTSHGLVEIEYIVP